MKLWIDADAAPRDVKDIVFRAADRLRVNTVLVANQRVPLPPGVSTVTAVRVAGGPDVADRHIALYALYKGYAELQAGCLVVCYRSSCALHAAVGNCWWSSSRRSSCSRSARVNRQSKGTAACW